MLKLGLNFRVAESNLQRANLGTTVRLLFRSHVLCGNQGRQPFPITN
uniref:Uncharacterized protein n=1 Tax=Manihot esculenta TaxID=3983 RepID=A0A2C9V3Q5_MANES